MLNRLLLLVDALLILAIVVLAGRLYEAWTEPTPAPSPIGTPSGASSDGPPQALQAGAPTRPPLSAFAVIAEQNLFSPTRSETAPAPPRSAPATAASGGPKPRLYGVVLGVEGGPRAFLEDPRTRKVFGYAIGDSVADSRVEEITGDRVVLSRGAEVFEVLLRDPSKPRPPTPLPTAPTVPGRLRPGVVPVPGAVPGARARPIPPGQGPAPAPESGEAQDAEASPGSPVPPGFPQIPRMPGQPGFPLPPGAPQAQNPS